MKYSVKYTSQFKKEFKNMLKRGCNQNEMQHIINLIAEGTNTAELCERYSDHALKGNWRGFRECHIRPDWLLVYEIVEDVLVLSLSRTGTHNDLFK